MFRQRQALQTWRTAVARDTNPPDVLDEDLVWQLLSFCCECAAGGQVGSATDEDIAKVAYDLAQRSLERMHFQDFLRIYRDLLVNAETERLDAEEESMARLAHFSNLITDAYWQAYSDTLRRTIREQRVEGRSYEMRLAKRIQQHLLPKITPTVPGFDFAGRLEPAAEIGGDYWSMKHYPDDRIVTMKLADITGHGIAAATLVAAVKFISGGLYSADQSPGWVMQQTNRVLVKETPADILVSMVYGWLYTETREIRMVNAGHEPVFFCREDACEDVPPTGPVLGVSESEYGERRYQFSPGDILFFCSDGIVDAGITEPFGIPRLKRMVTENRHLSAAELADLVIQAVYRYVSRPHDDLSLVIVKAVAE